MLALGASTLSGCKKGADEALVLFTVQTTAGVPAFEKLAFSVDGRPDLPQWVLPKPSGAQPWRLWYYLPGANGSLTIVGQAKNAAGCVVGKGMVSVVNVRAGQTTAVDAGATSILTITPATGGCDGGGGSGGSGGRGGAGSGGHGGQDAGLPDSGAGAADAANNGDGPAVKIELGLPCGADGDCASGHCVDSVCCESACNGACESCGEADTKGKCVGVTG
ncbi:MAG TPA: hypothetical protein VLT58_10340, partial [Polyangia bacterium]|nr:hypothetical protein [Polyangia bacterium]